MSLVKVILVSALVINCAIQSTNAVYTTKLTLLHFNDINSQLKPFERENPAAPGNWSGLGSLVDLLNNEAAKAKDNNPIRIAAGNLIGGESGWLSLVGWKEFGDLVEPFYKPEVVGLGFKEFEAGLNYTNDYIGQWNTTKRPVLVSNANCAPSQPFDPTSQEKKFCDTIRPFHKISLKSGENPAIDVGIIGFVNPLVEKLADPGKLTFEQDVVAALLRVLNTPDAKSIKTFIAVGSGTMDIAKDILAGVNKVKVVVLSGGSYEMKPDAYPTTHAGGFIVKAGQFGKTFGRLVVEISDSGNVDLVKDDSKLIDNEGGKDKDALKKVGDLETAKIKNATEYIIGHSLVKLEGLREKCWRAECNLGNLVADSMVHCALSKDILKKPTLADTIGIWTSGSIFDDSRLEGQKITEFDVHKILPYHNRAYLVAVTGKTLKNIFRTSGGAIKAPGNGNKDWGQFLQVSSGIEVHYSTEGDLKSLRVHHLNDSQPVLKEVDDEQLYDVVLPSFMYRGRSVYDYVPNNLISVGGQDLTDIGFDDECVHNYIKGLNVLSVGFEQRITISDDDGPGSCSKCSKGNTGLTVFLTLFIFVLIVGLVYVGWRFVWPRISQRGHTSHFP